jgi:dTDP-glucose 4,6-dehydratase
LGLDKDIGEKMRLLITGGAGFIGSNFIRYMIDKHPKYKITNLDKLTYAGNLNNLKGIDRKNYTFMKGDICNRKLMSPLIRKHDVVINFAAESHVDRSINQGEIFLRTNAMGPLVICDEARKTKTPVIQVSTDEVYGSRKTLQFREEDKLNPSSPYSASKAAGELVVMSYAHTHGLPIIITRSSNNYGPYQYPEKLIPLFVTNIVEGKKVPVYSKGLNMRDWLYVEDNCEAIDRVLHKGKWGETYNLGSANERKNIQITNEILKQLGKSKAWIKHVKDRPGHDWRYAITNSKLRKLGWKERTPFEKGISKTIQWYKDNEWWWKPLKRRK